MRKKVSKRNLSLDEFISTPSPEAWTKLQAVNKNLFKNCKNFSECHIQVRAETGIWIEELAPVFQKLDASLSERRRG